MNESNVDYLIKQVKFTGFGDSLEFKIRENIARDQPEFQLSHKPDFGNDRAEATLHFRRSDKGNYFFNKYDLEISREGMDPLKQSFNVSSAKAVAVRDKDNNIVLDQEGKPVKEWINNTFTSKEAYNFLEGRAVLKEFVNKDDVKVTLWSKADLGNKDQYGNYQTKTFPGVYKDEKLAFNLEAKLAQFPIKEMGTDEGKKQLIESLEKGNRQTVTMVESNGTEYKRSIEANPQFKTVNIYDGNQRVKHQSVKQGQEQQQSENQGQKNAAQKSAATEADDGAPSQPEKRQRNKRSQAI